MAEIQPAPHKVDKYDILNPLQRSEHRIVVEESPRRVRCTFNGETVAASTNMKLMHETRHLPVYYFPLEDVRQDLLERTDHSTHCPHKGDASYYSVVTKSRTLKDAVWSYENPKPAAAALKDHLAFYKLEEITVERI